MTFFDILGDVLTKKSGQLDLDPKFDSEMSGYMLVRYLSMSDKLVPYVEVLNSVQCTLNKSQLYRFAYKIIPKQNSGFLKYYVSKPKKQKV